MNIYLIRIRSRTNTKSSMSKMIFGLQWLVFLLLPLGAFFQEDDTNLDFVKAVVSNGYPVEAHHVETQDGYILTVFRIPHGQNSNITNPEPVLLTHGLLGSAENYITLGPKKSMGYVLADNGYDVWLINCRGTWHSKKHRTLKPTQKEFWQFSWHEIGIYDHPAVIDHILSITNQSSISYVGHSQGCTSLFVMGSERPEYNDKIKIMIALAPGAIYKHFNHPMMSMLISYLDVLENLSASLKIYEIPPSFMSAEELRDIFKLFCVDSNALRNTCLSLFMLFTDADPGAVTYDENSLQQIFPMMLGSASVNQLFHYAQLIKTGIFQQYDWGLEKNIEKYGTTHPPLYKLQNVTFPVALFYSKGDKFVTEKDVKLLATKLPNVIGLYKIPNEGFSHIDMIFASTIDKDLNKPALRVMKEFQNKHRTRRFLQQKRSES